MIPVYIIHSILMIWDDPYNQYNITANRWRDVLIESAILILYTKRSVLILINIDVINIKIMQECLQVEVHLFQRTLVLRTRRIYDVLSRDRLWIFIIETLNFPVNFYVLFPNK